MAASGSTWGNLQSLLYKSSLNILIIATVWNDAIKNAHPFLHLPAGKKRHAGFRLPTDGRRPAPRRLVSRG